MRGLLLSTLLTLGLLVGSAQAQNESITTNNIQPAIPAQGQCIGPTTANCVTIDTSGLVAFPQPHTDAFVFVPAVGGCIGDTTNFTPTRVAASDWALARTMTATEIIRISCSLNSWLQRASGTVSGGGTKGVKITAIRLHHQITVKAIAASWGKIATRGFANNTANDVGPDRMLAGGGAAPTLPTAVQTQPYLTTATLTTPLYLPQAANQAIDVEWSVEGPINTVYRLYGVTVVFSRLDH